MPAAHVTAVVLAGGAGTRFGAPVSKVLIELGGRPVLARSLEVLDACDAVDDVVLVVRSEDRDAIAAVRAPRRKLRAVVDGGATRQDSEWAGLQAVRAVAAQDDAQRDGDRANRLVLLHDAARPLVAPGLVTALVDAARASGGGAIPAIAVEDDLVDADGRGVPSGDLVAVQTPQAFGLALLLDAYPRAREAGVEGLDTAQTVQAVTDAAVTWVPSSPDNLKVTHPEDLAAAEAVLARREGGAQA